MISPLYPHCPFIQIDGLLHNETTVCNVRTKQIWRHLEISWGIAPPLLHAFCSFARNWKVPQGPSGMSVVNQLTVLSAVALGLFQRFNLVEHTDSDYKKNRNVINKCK